ncbi:MAG: threonine ammonia-lyase, biosynthetic [Gammaproteobacteria bacterium]|nr:threonine ammonia-lyase, biosynthetic [Gammaproteobacteria bacterium]
MLSKYLKKILTAPVYDVAVETPLDHAPRLSARLNNSVFLKREDQQSIFSFKLRGAYNKIYQLTKSTDIKGVIAASAGNHAQGVALAASKLNLHATIVMPKTAPDIKVAAVRALGGKVILFGDAYDDAYEHAKALADEKQITFIHPYDDPDVIAGQGTVALEILRQTSAAIDAIFVPVGGGGLIAGVAAYVKSVDPSIKVIGVEPENSACLYRALEKNRRVKLDHVGIFADGVAVKQIGKEPFKVIKETVDEVVLVTTDEISAAIKDIYDENRCIVEPAGGLAVAGIKKYISKHQCVKRHFVAINSGANMNFDRLRHVAERAELGEQREALLAVKIPEAPGSFLRFCNIIGKRQITEFNYRYSDQAEAVVFAGLRLTEGKAEQEKIIKLLSDKSYSVTDLTDNELAKLHVRYMVGGHAAAAVADELLWRFQFPERPGALLEFLKTIGQRWNISMFHYRNHGADYGRVLMGVQIPAGEKSAFNKLLKDLGYVNWEETDNEAYRLFLG